MTTRTKAYDLPCYVGGQAVSSDNELSVYNPYNGELVGTVPMLGREHVELTITSAIKTPSSLTRYERYEILNRTRDLIGDKADELANLIRMEAGLCMRETRYEVGRARDVLQFAAMEALRDDGQTFSCDVSPQGKDRKIFN